MQSAIFVLANDVARHRMDRPAGLSLPRKLWHIPPHTDYRHNRISGGTYFFTVNLRDRKSDLLTTHIDILRHAVRETRSRMQFHIDAWVVLPDHLHCLWTLPPGDADFPNRWRVLHGGASGGALRRSAMMDAARSGQRGRLGPLT